MTRNGLGRMALLLLGAAVALSAQQETRFVSAAVCSDCHSRLYPPGVAENWSGMRPMMRRGAAPTTPDPDSVAPHALWSGSMMALSAIDLYWQARVRYESRKTPAAASGIEDACASCHAPMQRYDLHAQGIDARLDALDAKGREGVSCTTCHQIDEGNLGEAESFTAGFVINDQDRIYGPHRDPFPHPMRMHTGRTPTYGPHMLEAGVCGTCHVVITPTLNAAGEQTGRFLEQATYLEWLASGYPKADKTCRTCHMPQLEDADGNPAKQYIAHTPHGGYFPPTRPREPFGQHTFQGANFAGAELLAAAYPDLETVLEPAAERARTMLAESLSLTLAAKLEDGKLLAQVGVVNRSGHKLPSGFPSRRLWLHLAVRDGAGRAIFESGAWDAASGEIRARAAGARGPAEPHYRRISSPAQTQIYEMEMADPAGAHTLALLRAGRTLKDNRVLPMGFDASRAELPGLEGLSILPVGVEDEDFRAGADQVLYEAPLGDSAGPWRVTLEALYQSVKPSHAAQLDGAKSEEERRFLAELSAAVRPLVIARAEATVSRR